MSDEIKVGPAPIQTPEDAQMAYLRQEIDEDTYRKYLAKFGTVPGQAVGGTVVERADSGFLTKIPDDLVTPPSTTVDTEEVIKQVNEKQKARDEAAAADAPKEEPAPKETKKVEAASK